MGSTRKNELLQYRHPRDFCHVFWFIIQSARSLYSTILLFSCSLNMVKYAFSSYCILHANGAGTAMDKLPVDLLTD
jgi:hypothetical protein